jgi:hypothetical protein
MKRLKIYLTILVFVIIAFFFIGWITTVPEYRPSIKDFALLFPAPDRKTINFDTPVDIYYITEDNSLMKYSYPDGDVDQLFKSESGYIKDFDKNSGRVLCFEMIENDSMKFAIIDIKSEPNDTVLSIKTEYNHFYKYFAGLYQSNKILLGKWRTTSLYYSQDSIRIINNRFSGFDKTHQKAYFGNYSDKIYAFENNTLQNIYSTDNNSYIQSVNVEADKIVTLERSNTLATQFYKINSLVNKAPISINLDVYTHWEIYFVANSDQRSILIAEKPHVVIFPYLGRKKFYLKHIYDDNGNLFDFRRFATTRKKINNRDDLYRYLNYTYFIYDKKGEVYFLDYVEDNLFEFVGQKTRSKKFELKKKDIPSMIYYPKAMHKQLAFQGLKEYVKTPISHDLCKTVLSIPIHPYMTEKDISLIVDEIVNIIII